MNRRNFLKSILGVVAVAVTAPTLFLPKSTQAAVPRAAVPTTSMRPFSNMDFINTRHMVHSIEQHLQHYIGEVNDNFTRRSVHQSLSEYLEFAKRNRAIQDYRVVCDESNNSPELIDQYSLVTDVYVQPKRALSYIQIHTVVTP